MPVSSWRSEARSSDRVARLRASAPALGVVVVVWLGLAGGLSALTSRITDWFVMGDELLYERLALSIVGSGSPIPRVHEQVISNINQLYPLVIATVYRHGLIPHGFHEAHVLNAFVMTSVALPAYLLARRVTRSTWLSWFVAVAAATVPWIVLSSFLLTEVVAYPAFVWALLGMHASLSRPSPRTDLLAVGGIVLAILARTQFYALAGVLPAAVIAVGISTHRLRETLRAHVALAVVYALGFVAAVAVVATGHALLGTYSTTVSSNPLPPQIAGSAPAHFAIVALAGGLLPALIGGAWLASNLRRSESEERVAFAWLGIIAVIGLTVEAASFNLRFGGGLVRERYLFYITPILLVAMVAGLSAARRPRWSVALPLAVLAIGFWQAPLVAFQKLNVDTPASVLNDWLLNTMRSPNGARAFLVLADELGPRCSEGLAECRSSPGCAGRSEARTQGASIAEAIDATEDAASGRPARPGAQRGISPSPPTRPGGLRRPPRGERTSPPPPDRTACRPPRAGGAPPRRQSGARGTGGR